MASINGITHQVSIAPPVSATSVMFIANSIDTIDTNDIPIAVLKAAPTAICLIKTIVSNAIEVSIPLSIANDFMVKTDQSGPQC